MNNRFSKFLTKVLSIVLLIHLSLMTGVAQSALFEQTDHNVETVYKKDKTARWHSKVSIRQSTLNQGAYDLRIDAKGQYAGYKNVTWISQAQIQESQGVLLVLTSSTKVFSKQRIIFQSTKQYDYKSKVVSVELSSEKKDKPSRFEFPIKGPICDDVTMLYVFNKINLWSKAVENNNFYLLTNEPKLYHVTIKSRPEEVLNYPSGQIAADKFQLMADLGPLTELASKMVPPTYIWFAKNDLRHWLQYEGMETGYETANIVSYRQQGNIESLAR